MKGLAGTVRWSLLLVAASLLLAPRVAAQPATHTIYGLVQGTNQLIRFNSTTPGTIDATIPITGVLAGETLRGIDFRPATGQLFAIGTDAVGATVRLYAIDIATGVATGFAPATTFGTPGTQWGMGFNPVVDRVRIVNNAGENARLNPNNGALAANDTDLSGPAALLVDAVAYDREFDGATQTTLFAINRATNSLARQGGVNGTPSPNGGVITDIGPLGVTIAGSSTAFEITTDGTFFAAMRPTGGTENLYTLNPGTGAATLVGAIGNGAAQLDAIAVVSPTLAISPGTGNYTSRQRFDLVLTANLLGRRVVSGTATFDGTDVTGFLARCVVPGTTSSGASTLRCANLGGPVVGPGSHVLAVTLVLSDGSLIRSSVTWNVAAVTEP